MGYEDGWTKVDRTWVPPRVDLGVQERFVNLENRASTVEGRATALEASDVALDGRLDTLEAKQYEIWTSSTLPTTNLYTGRLIYVTGLSSNWNLQLLVYNSFFWRVVTPRRFTHIITGGNITSSAVGVTTAGVNLGATPTGLEISTQVHIEGETDQVQSGEVTRWQIRNNAGTSLRQAFFKYAHHADPVPFYPERLYLDGWEHNIAAGTTIAYSYHFQDDAGTAVWGGVDTFGEAWNMIVTVT